VNVVRKGQHFTPPFFLEGDKKTEKKINKSLRPRRRGRAIARSLGGGEKGKNGTLLPLGEETASRPLPKIGEKVERSSLPQVNEARDSKLLLEYLHVVVKKKKNLLGRKERVATGRLKKRGKGRSPLGEAARPSREGNTTWEQREALVKRGKEKEGARAYGFCQGKGKKTLLALHSTPQKGFGRREGKGRESEKLGRKGGGGSSLCGKEREKKEERFPSSLKEREREKGRTFSYPLKNF